MAEARADGSGNDGGQNDIDDAFFLIVAGQNVIVLTFFLSDDALTFIVAVWSGIDAGKSAIDAGPSVSEGVVSAIDGGFRGIAGNSSPSSAVTYTSLGVLAQAGVSQ